jgi:predicted nucleotidyltransferase
MTQPHPRSERVAELHRLADADYAKGQAERNRAHLAQPLYGSAALAVRDKLREPSDLEVAIRVAQQLLDSDSVLSLREALRLMLRAVGAEPVTEEEAARRFVDRHFPEVAAFLATERGEGQ